MPTNSNDACLNDCRLASCGDNFVHEQVECDDITMISRMLVVTVRMPSAAMVMSRSMQKRVMTQTTFKRMLALGTARMGVAMGLFDSISSKVRRF